MMKIDRLPFRLHALVSALILVPLVSAAQTVPPDAGDVLQRMAPTIKPPKEQADLQFNWPEQGKEVVPGGAVVAIKGISFTGNTLFSSEVLAAQIPEAIGKSYDLAGLRQLAAQISAYYRSQGYPFTRAFIAPQDLSAGELRIDVVEGRYGAVKAEGKADSQDQIHKLSDGAERFLAQLKSGDMIESASIERVALLIDDQPDMAVSPLIRPGEQLGAGDLTMAVSEESRFGGQLGADNAGSYYTGEYRLRADLYLNSPFTFGDRIVLRGLVTDENLWLGSIDYEIPLNGKGLRGQIGYAHTTYQLGKEFEALDATGYADVTTARLSYPWLRSQRSNVYISAGWQHKELEDKYGGLINVTNNKSSSSVPLTLQFDHRDRFGGGGITYGAVTAVGGQLHLEADDADLSRTEGFFSKFNLDVARIQRLPGSFSVYGRFSGQWAGNRNLDSSEGFSIGGLNGVRAYPSGEGAGDEGWLAQVEFRYQANEFTPYVFYDAGTTKVDAKPSGPNPEREIAGAGIGTRFLYKDFSFDAMAAWRTSGGKPESDPTDRKPRVWVTTTYKF